ncbi:23S rRNA (guanosine(2251)-2'-O)-methyltransferase RlmB [Myxococcota bacterium]|jgi:23S rRNA (guanosine2251-2'-O)-methyltransferase|nr:23S rRNA (guanosine(2251)-2'-O)-methyltransferase RlmB [Myxococcota bacterium]
MPDREGEIAGGLHLVEALLHEARGQVQEILLEVQASRPARALAEEARSLGIPVRSVSPEALRAWSRGRNFQGIAVRLRPYPYASFEDWLGTPDAHPLVLALDSIQDPQNLGSILRTAAFYGVAGVVIPKDRAVGVTGAVLRASAGAVARVPVARVVNLARALREAGEAGWRVIGAVAHGGVGPEGMPRQGPRILVMGAEGAGLRRLVLEACDTRVTLPSPGRFESLNVGVATGILLEWLAGGIGGGSE